MGKNAWSLSFPHRQDPGFGSSGPRRYQKGIPAMSEKKPRVNKLILDVVEKQLESCRPVQTRETLDRLMAQGFSEEDAKHLIGSAMVVEMRSVVSEGRTFQEERFVSLLQDLPRLP
jgi:hypothetical protein